MIEKLKQHVKDHKIAGITFLIVRNVVIQPISSSVTGIAGSSVTGTGKKVVINNVSFISAERQGYHFERICMAA